MHAGLSRPHATQHRDSPEQRRGLPQKVDQNGTVEIRANRIARRLARRTEEAAPKAQKNVPGPIQSTGTNQGGIHQNEVAQRGNGQDRPPRLLTASGPPKREQSQSRVHPENDEGLVSSLLQADARPRPTAQALERRETSRQAL